MIELDKDFIDLLQKIKDRIDAIDTFNLNKAEENNELKWEASNLLLLALDKLKS